MLQALGPFRPILLAALTMMLGQGVMGTILPMRLAQLDASAQAAGLVTTAYFLGQVIGTRLGNRLLARAGHIRAFAAMVAVVAISCLLVPILPYPGVWIGLRLVAGICTVLAILVMESWLNIAADNRVRGSVFGAYMVVVYVGLTGGQALIGVLDPAAFSAFSFAAIALMVAILPMTLTERAQPDLPPAARLRLVDLFRISPVGIAAAVSSGALTGAMFGLFPFYATGVGLQTAEVAGFMASVIGGGLVLSWPLGRLSDLVDRRAVIAAAAVAIVASSAGLAFGDKGLLTLALAGGLMGGATAALYSLGVAHTNDYVGGIDAVAVGAGLLLAFGIGAITGPLLAGAAMDWIAADALFAYTGIVAVALTALAGVRILTRRAVSGDDKTGFVNLSRTTPVAYALDPWSGDDAAADHTGEPVT